MTEEPTTGDVTGRNLAPAPNGVTGVQLTPKKTLALILGLGLPVVVAAGWVLGQRQATGTPADGSGAMGTAPHERVPSPAAQYDVYDDAPTLVPMATTLAAPSPKPKRPKPTEAPEPAVQPTVVPEDQTPSPEPSPADTSPSPEEPSPEPQG